jgi:hypothetical protein
VSSSRQSLRLVCGLDASWHNQQRHIPVFTQQCVPRLTHVYSLAGMKQYSLFFGKCSHTKCSSIYARTGASFLQVHPHRMIKYMFVHSSRSPVRSPMAALTPSTPSAVTRRGSLSSLAMFFRKESSPGPGPRCVQSFENEGSEAGRSSKKGFFRAMSPSRLNIFSGGKSPTMSRVSSFESLPEVSAQDMRRIGARVASPVSPIYAANRMQSKLESDIHETHEDSGRALHEDVSGAAALTPKMITRSAKDSIRGDPSPLQLNPSPPQLTSFPTITRSMSPCPIPRSPHAITVYQDSSAK